MTRRPDVRTILSRGPAVAVLGALALTVLVWAAAVPLPPHVIPRPTSTGPLIQQGYDDTDIRLPGEADAAPFRPLVAHSLVDVILGWAVIVLFGLALLALLAWVLRTLWRAWANRRRAVAPDAGTVDLDRLAHAVVTDHEGRLVALAGGTPAEGIVAAWDRLEATLRGAGVTLPASRTSTETALDVLRRFPVDADALEGLALLYREASWSRHPLTEADRERAEAALRALDDGLSRPRSPVRHG